VLGAIKSALKKPVLIFDIDGTLVETSSSYDVAIKKTFEKFAGKKISLEEIRLTRNREAINSDWKITHELLIRSGKNPAMEKVVQEFQKFYLGKNFSGLILKERLLLPKSTITELSGKYSLAIFTGRPRKEAEFALKKFGILDCFSEILCMEDVPKNLEKPDPFGINLIKKRFAAKKYIYFGDTTADAKAAHRAGIESAIIMPKGLGKNSAKMFREAGAGRMFKRITEAVKVIK